MKQNRQAVTIDWMYFILNDIMKFPSKRLKCVKAFILINQMKLFSIYLVFFLFLLVALDNIFVFILIYLHWHFYKFEVIFLSLFLFRFFFNSFCFLCCCCCRFHNSFGHVCVTMTKTVGTTNPGAVLCCCCLKGLNSIFKNRHTKIH